MMERGKLNISQWAAEDRPREKMMLKGAEALSDAELLDELWANLHGSRLVAHGS